MFREAKRLRKKKIRRKSCNAKSHLDYATRSADSPSAEQNITLSKIHKTSPKNEIKRLRLSSSPTGCIDFSKSSKFTSILFRYAPTSQRDFSIAARAAIFPMKIARKTYLKTHRGTW